MRRILLGLTLCLLLIGATTRSYPARPFPTAPAPGSLLVPRLPGVASPGGSATPIGAATAATRTVTATNSLTQTGSLSHTVTPRLVYTPLPLRFDLNEGQTDRRVLYLARGTGYTLFLTAQEAVWTIGTSPGRTPLPETLAAGATRQLADLEAVREDVVALSFPGSNAHPRVGGQRQFSGHSNYYIGNDRRQWHEGVPAFARVDYRDLYPGIDLTYYSQRGVVALGMVVAPGADARRIRLAVSGGRGLTVDTHGDLVLRGPWGQAHISAPMAYQDTGPGSARHLVAAHFIVTGANTVRLALGRYDTRRQLVVEPMTVFSAAFYRGSLRSATAISVDAAGNSYVAGLTASPVFPGDAPARAYVLAPYGAFVAKASPADGGVDYDTLIGGSGNDAAAAVAVDGTGNAYLAGRTSSANFPIKNALQRRIGGGSDAFVARIDREGRLAYSTYLGGRGTDVAYALAVDSAGEAYVAGATGSANLPLSRPIQRRLGGASDAFVATLNAQGSALVYSTYLGGKGADAAYALAVDSAGAAYVTGQTRSDNFPTVSPLQPHLRGQSDAFVAKIAARGNALAYSTYLGGVGAESGNGIAVDAAGEAWVVGSTTSTDFATALPVQARPGGKADAFAAKLNAAGNALMFSTYLGGAGTDAADAVALDPSGNAYLSGYSDSLDFPLVRAALTRGAAGPERFVARIASTGYRVDFNTFVGGVDSSGLAVDRFGTVYLAGQTVLAGNTALPRPDRSYGDYLVRIGSSAGVTAVAGLTGNPADLSLQAGASSPTSAISSTEAISTSEIFGAATTFGVGSAPAAVAGGDVNGDGIADLVVANRASNDVSVLLGRGDGTFAPAVNYPAGTGPVSVALGDFNLDGAIDIAVAAEGSNAVSVLLGKGDGTFAPAVSIAVGAAPQSLAVGDWNGDGFLDLVVANSGDNNVSVLLGKGDGTFAPAVNYPVGTAPGSVAVADLNGDGVLDLAVADGGSNEVSVLLGQRDGTFGPAVTFAVGTDPLSIAAGDLNGDGVQDLAVADNGSGDVRLLLGKGDGTFTTAHSYATAGAPLSVAIGDVNGDGKPDLVLAEGNAGVGVLPGNGDGTFGAAGSYAVAGAEALALADLNGDGSLDLVAALAPAGALSVLLNATPNSAFNQKQLPVAALTALAQSMQTDVAQAATAQVAAQATAVAEATAQAMAQQTAVAEARGADLYGLAPSCRPAQCFAVGAGGALLRSTDGSTWISLDNPALDNGTALHAVSCPTSTTCFAVGDNGYIIATEDASDPVPAWSLRSATFGLSLNAISCLDAADCTAVGTQGTILRTTDGYWWQPVDSGTTTTLNGLACLDASRCIAAGNGGLILTNQQNGTWSAQSSPVGSDLLAVSCAIATACSIVGAGGAILHSADGLTWSAVTNPAATAGATLRAISCAAPAACTAAGDGGTVLVTLDAADASPAWVALASGVSATLNAIACPDARSCFIAGAGGTVAEIASVPAPTATASSTATPTTTATQTATITPSATATPAETAPATSTATVTPSETETPTETAMVAPPGSATPAETSTPAETVTPATMATPTPVEVGTPSATPDAMAGA